ncbi:STAS domain-containing protein [Actinoplanes sp. L3-i22]|uniref:STAS domain-containing protein n=1 Tax=Actinoplanes sp. L3-i22 TaxID=2836373 RepID=UPI001C777F9B|nr:STAS domain-containing protein [Actinoplanes sp. L3-i22]BCY09940.1 hypothetical protein L3i22_050280 [Actinoplanes sp. L3-i22]
MTYFTDDGSRLHVAVRHDGDRTTVTVTGELDLLSGPPLMRLLEDALDDSVKQLDVAAAQLDFVDVAGVRVLLAAHRLAVERGVELRLCDPPPHVVWLLRVIDEAGLLLGGNPRDGDLPPHPYGSSPTSPAVRFVDDATARADERDRRADERDRRADERDEQAADRDRLAEERDRLAEEREEHVRQHQRWEDVREELADARERALERREQDEPEP